MENSQIHTIRSSVTRELKRASLNRALLFGTSGAFLLLGTFFFPWRLPLFAGSLLLITLGLRPYRLLAQLEIHPHTFSMSEEGYLYAQKGKPLFSIPKEHITRMEYYEKGALYGIAIDLCGQTELLRKFDLPAFVADSRSRANCDLFLPYFTERSFKKL